jgi:hypothetical protein
MRAKKVQKVKRHKTRVTHPLSLPVPMIVHQEIEIVVPSSPTIPSVPDSVKPSTPFSSIDVAVDKVITVEKPVETIPTVTQPDTQIIVSTVEPKPWLLVRIIKRLIDPILKVWNLLIVPIYNQFARLGVPVHSTINFLSGKKTYLVSLVTICVLYSHYNSGQIDLNTLVHQGSEMLLAMTFRSAISQRNNT